MTDKADLDRERVSLQPVRELMTITSVDTFTAASLGRRQDLFLICGYVFQKPIEQRRLRTPSGFMATLCRAKIGLSPLQLTWKRNPFNNKSWLEYDLLKVELP